MATIDVFAENYSPAPSDETAVWDKTLFYALEGYGDEGGYVNKNNCNLIRKQLKNAATGNIIQYEIYLNPNSGNPNKIVSIENVESGIDVMEYYYTEDGKINFIFKYSTDNYVTTYATPDKDGQRFLFNNDALCTWRVISDGGIANFVHGQNEADRLKDSYHSNEIFLYSDLSDEQKNQVNTYEKQMINAAYNTLNAVMAADGVATISGLAVDSNGNALPNAKIQFLADDKTTELFSCTTDDAGAYNILVPIADYNYNISVSYDGCLPCSIYDILINASNIEAYPDTAYMIPESDSEAEVQLTLGDAANYAEDGETLKRLSNAVINVRAGINNKLGDILYTFNSDENGYSAMSVKAGVYTIEVQATGYESMYYTIVSNPTVGTSSYSFYAAPELAEGQLAVVLTWGETPNDLDSHLFTSSGNDTQQVWYSNRSDDYGNWLDVDDTSSYGPETITISQFDTSKYYKYCVVDYTNSSAGNANSTEMSYSGANVSVYNSNGLIASYNMPKNVNALVWEVFEIRNGVVSPIQRYYNNNSVENNYWWDGNDDSDWAQAYLDLLNSLSEDDWDYYELRGGIGLFYLPNQEIPVLRLPGMYGHTLYWYNRENGNNEESFIMGWPNMINYKGEYKLFGFAQPVDDGYMGDFYDFKNGYLEKKGEIRFYEETYTPDEDKQSLSELCEEYGEWDGICNIDDGRQYYYWIEGQVSNDEVEYTIKKSENGEADDIDDFVWGKNSVINQLQEYIVND